MESSLYTAVGFVKQVTLVFLPSPLAGGCVTVYRQQKGRKVCVCVYACALGVVGRCALGVVDGN